MSRSKAEIFLEQYRKLEYTIRNKYHLENHESAVGYLEKHEQFQNIANEIRFCREVRNLLTHKPKVRQEYCVEPSEEMIGLINKIIKNLENPPVIMDIAIPAGKIFYKTFSDDIKMTLRQMNDRSFGTVPILENGVVKAVLSEKVVMNYIVKEEKYQIGEGLQISDMRDYILPENHGKEKYIFVSQDALIGAVSNQFHDYLSRGYRIGMVFITKHGREDEKLLGIATAWDLASV